MDAVETKNVEAALSKDAARKRKARAEKKAGAPKRGPGRPPKNGKRGPGRPPKDPNAVGNDLANKRKRYEKAAKDLASTAEFFHERGEFESISGAAFGMLAESVEAFAKARRSYLGR